MPGISTVNTWDDNLEIHGPGHERRKAILPITVEAGQNLVKGTVIGIQPATEKYVAYDDDKAAVASSPAADAGNTGGGSCGSVDVQDDYTLSQSWELLCTEEATGGGTFSVTGSVSGLVGDASVGSQFRWPDSAAYQVRFTIADGDPDYAEGDKFTFTTTAAGARTAEGILPEAVDASNGDILSSVEVGGVWELSKLTGYDANAKTDMGASIVGNGVYLMK